MSEIKVNKITPRSDCGTTTLGDSGDSITVSGDLKSNSLKATDGGVIISQSGTTITLGASGDTVAIATGASTSGMGRTGTVDWQTTPKTATFTAVNGEGYFCNTAGGTFEVDLPAGSAGAIVAIQDYNNTFDTAGISIDPNGSEKINGGDAGGPIVVNTEGEGLTLVYVDSTVGWRSIHNSAFTDAGSNFISATGGTITTCGNCKVHTFTGPGSFVVASAASPTANSAAAYVVVAGGGGGGGVRAGGGGAGGYREGSDQPITPYTASPMAAASPSAITLTAQTYPITVGGGGTAAGNTTNTSGANSVFSTITSTGGGRGGTMEGGPSNHGGDGGSGGGGGGGWPSGSTNGGSGNTPPTSPAQGKDGANGQQKAGSGGGGGTACGATGTSGGPAGNGGNGTTTCISFPGPVAYAGGGGGGTQCGSKGNGGTGGGGAGGQGTSAPGNVATDGTDNTGGGGGGGGDNATGGAGGSGIVIIRYKYK